VTIRATHRDSNP